ncbi:MAG: hypothetical protein K2P99_02650 [Burkholderiales bacterium]|nr:hypothetical protein [Burkholderiales bacterium]
MTIFGIIITALLEQQKYLNNIRNFFYTKLVQYVKFFITRDFKNQREIRYAYVVACSPLVLILILLHMVLYKFGIIHFTINMLIFIMCVQILTWKEEAKITTQHNKSFQFINSFATKFFAPLFWFWLLPLGTGVFIYLLVMIISNELKHKNLDLVVYNVVVDKMLFYINVLPYTILYIFIAFAGDFENVSHYLISQRKNFTKGFYFLEEMLNDIILIAIDKDKYENDTNEIEDNTESGIMNKERFSVPMVKYIVAVLYRSGLFFVATIALVGIAHLFGLIA